jgi:hypothetical protein
VTDDKNYGHLQQFCPYKDAWVTYSWGDPGTLMCTRSNVDRCLSKRESFTINKERHLQFLNQIIGLIPRASHTRQEQRPIRRRRSPMVLETLENRNLLSIAGVGVAWGNLSIQAPAGSHGNAATVSIDPSNHNVKVSFNGQWEEFSGKLVTSITYLGGSGGGDTFTNNTNLVSLDYAFGQHNNFTGGTGFNYVYFFGSNNTYNAKAGSCSDVFEIGNSETINNPDGATVQTYVY